MRREEFKNWLINSYNEGMDEKAAESRVSNAQRVELVFGDLDECYKKDKLVYVLESLKYSQEDSRLNRKLPFGLEIEGDYYTGMSSLRQGVRRYIEFCNSTNNQ